MHAPLAVVLVLYPWNFHDMYWVLGALAIPIGQNGLVSLWAAAHASPSYLRLIGLSLALVATWYVAITVMTFEASSEDGAAWGFAFVARAIVAVLLTVLWRVAVHLAAGRREAIGTAEASRFSLATLLLWTAAVTVPLVLLRLAVTQFGWTIRVFGYEFSPHLAVIGEFNGLFAAVVFWSLRLRGPVWLRIPLGCLLVVGLAAAEPYLPTWAFATTGGMDLEASLALAAGQLLALYGTLIPLQWAAGRASRDGRHRPAARTAAEAP